MMMRVLKCLPLIAAIAVTGCVSAARVHQEKEKVGGVPFFLKRAVWKQTTVYEVRWDRVTLELSAVVPEGGKAPPAQTLSKDVSTDEPELGAFRKLAARATLRIPDEHGLIPGLDDVLKKFGELSPADVDRSPDPCRAGDLVSNSVSEDTVVDYGKPYYLNGALPWFGSTKVEADLNADGTLGKASVEPESKLAEGISTLLPLKEFLTGRFVPKTAEETNKVNTMVAGLNVLALQYSLTVEPMGYRYTFTANFATDPCAGSGPNSKTCTLDPLTKETSPLWERTPIEAKKEEKKDDEKAFAFTGKVVLPKEEPKKP